MVLVVQDDGRGFDPTHASPAFGIRGMRERALMVRARLEVDSAPGRGTVVTLRNPGVSVLLKIRPSWLTITFSYGRVCAWCWTRPRSRGGRRGE